MARKPSSTGDSQTIQEPDTTSEDHDVDPEQDPSTSVLVEALASGQTYAEAGAVINVSARTVSRRAENPQFAARVTRRRAELADEARERIRRVADTRVRGVLRAQAVLQELLEDTDPKVRLAAARELHSTHATVTAVILEERIAQLEEAGKVRQGGTTPSGFPL